MTKWLIPFLLLTSAAFAQQPDPQKLLAVIESQRNMALTLHAQSEARAMALAEEVAALKAKIAELEKAKEAEK